MKIYCSYSEIEQIIASQYNIIVNIKKIDEQINLTLPQGYYANAATTDGETFWVRLKKATTNFILRHWDFDFVLAARSGKLHLKVNDITLADDIVDEIGTAGNFISPTGETSCEIDPTILLALLTPEESISPTVRITNVQMEQKGIYLNLELD